MYRLKGDQVYSFPAPGPEAPIEPPTKQLMGLDKFISILNKSGDVKSVEALHKTMLDWFIPLLCEGPEDALIPSVFSNHIASLKDIRNKFKDSIAMMTFMITLYDHIILCSSRLEFPLTTEQKTEVWLKFSKIMWEISRTDGWKDDFASHLDSLVTRDESFGLSWINVPQIMCNLKRFERACSSSVVCSTLMAASKLASDKKEEQGSDTRLWAGVDRFIVAVHFQPGWGEHLKFTLVPAAEAYGRLASLLRVHIEENVAQYSEAFDWK